MTQATGSHPAPPWQAVELVVESEPPRATTGSVARPLARLIYRALFELDRHSVTLLVISGHTRERYLLRAHQPGSHAPEIYRLAVLAQRELPPEIGVTIVDVDPTPLGDTPVPVHRLLTTRDRPVERGTTPSPTPFEQLLEMVSEIQPHAVQLIASRFKNKWMEASIRIADFSPGTTVQTAAGDARYHETAPNFAAPFEKFNATTNRELIFEHGWERHDETRLPGPPVPIVTRTHGATPKIKTLASARTLSRSPTEYAALFHARPPEAPLTSTYAQHQVLPWIRVDSELFPAFCGLRSQTYATSPWATLPGRGPPIITPRSPNREPAPPAASPPPATPTPSATDLEVETALGQRALHWFREHGVTITHGLDSPFEEFTAIHPDREQRCVVLTDPAFSRGDLIAVAAAVHQDPNTDELAVLADSSTIAARALACLQQPFEITSAGKTRLYEQSTPLREDIATAVRDRTAATEWTLTPAGAVVYHHKGNAVLGCSRNESLSTLVSSFPRAYQQDDEILVRTAAGEDHRLYATPDAFFDEWEFVCPPAAPTWLAGGLEFVTVLTTEGTALREYQQQASWDRPQLINRDRDAAANFFATYTVSDSDRSLSVSAVEAEFVAWLRHQTEEPIAGSFAHNLENKFPGSVEDAHDGELPGRTWRYPFGDTTG